MAALAGGVSKRGSDVCLAQADEAQEDDVGFVLDELEAEEILNLEAIDFPGPVEAEAFQGLDDGKAGILDSSERGAVGPQSGLAFDELGEIVEVGTLFAGGAGGQRGAVFTDKGQAQVFEVAIEGSNVGLCGLHGFAGAPGLSAGS